MNVRSERQRRSEELDYVLINARIDVSSLEEDYRRFEAGVRRVLRQSSDGVRITRSVRDRLVSIRISVEKCRNKFEGNYAEFRVLQNEACDEFESLRTRVEVLREKLCDLERRCAIAEDFDTLSRIQRS